MIGDSDDPGGMGTSGPRNDANMRSHVPAHTKSYDPRNNTIRDCSSTTNRIGKP